MEKIKASLLIIVALTTVMFFGVSCKREAAPPPPVDLSNFDKSVLPGDDFFRFVNGSWLVNNPIPDDFSRYGSFEQLTEQNEAKLFELITEIRNDNTAAPGSNRQKIRDFFNSAMDTVAQNELGKAPIQFMFDRIDELDDMSQIPGLISWLHNNGVRALFSIMAVQDRKNTEQMIAAVGQGGIGMTDRDYYLRTDERTIEIRQHYKDFIESIFSLAGYSAEEATQAQEVIMDIETQLAQASMTRLQRRDPHATYNKMSIGQLGQITPAFDWNIFLDGLNIDVTDLNVSQPLFFEGKNQLLQRVPVENWKTYLKYHVLRTFAPYIGHDFDQAQFAFYGTVMTGSIKQRERWERALSSLNSALGEAVGQEYVAIHFPPEAKERMEDLVEHLKMAFRQRLEQLDWMTAETKKSAFEKLERMNVKIGYPEKWIDYSAMEIENQPFVLNIITARRFNIHLDLAEIGKPVDREKWLMSPQTVNAYYNPTMNEIVFPAAILQPPFFYLHGDHAVNFGAIGMVIGHEIIHGFDDQGRKFGPDGNLREWWTPEDNDRFVERSMVLVEQFNNYVMLDTLTINGKLSLGENIADLGGLTMAYHALQNKLREVEDPGLIDGFTPEQRFFISYAQIWRHNIRDERLMQQLKEGPHAPGEARVNGIVYNMEEFYQAFGITQENSKRFIEPERRAAIW